MNSRDAPVSFSSLCRHPFTAFCHSVPVEKGPNFTPHSWLILKYLDFMALSVYSWNSVTLPRCLNLMIIFVTFSQHIRYFLISTKLFPITDLSYFVLLCFVLLSTSRIPFICMLDLCFQTFLSLIFSTCFHLLLLFLCICTVFWKLFSTSSTLFLVCGFCLLLL